MPEVVKIRTYRLNSGSHTGPDEHGNEQTWQPGSEFKTSQDLSKMAGPDPKGFKFSEIIDAPINGLTELPESEPAKTKHGKHK